MDFGTVDVGFESIETPKIYTKVNNTVNNGDLFINKTRIEGNHKGHMVWDEDEQPTKIYKESPPETSKKLPRTGF